MIGILTVSHNRPKIDKAFCLMIARITKDYPGMFLPICAVSLPEEARTFEEHGIETYLYANNPVSNKHNYILGKLKDRVTHVLHIGSDDIINNNYLNELLKYKDNDLVWGVGLYFLSSSKGLVRFWDMPFRQAAGPAKLMSAELMDRCNWHIWEDGLDHALDHSCYRIMEPHIRTKHIFKAIDIDGIMVDIKSDVNINPFETFARIGKPVNIDYLYNRLSEPEVNYLKSLQQ